MSWYASSGSNTPFGVPPPSFQTRTVTEPATVEVTEIVPNKAAPVCAVAAVATVPIRDPKLAVSPVTANESPFAVMVAPAVESNTVTAPAGFERT